MNIERAYSWNALATADLQSGSIGDAFPGPGGAGGLTIASGVGRGGTNCLRITNGNTWTVFNLAGNYNEFAVAMAWSGSSQLLGQEILQIYDAGTKQLSVLWRTDGRIDIRRGTTPILMTSVGSFGVALSHLYLRFVIHNTTGVIELRKNGVLDQAIMTGLNTRVSANNFATSVRLGTDNDGNNSMTWDVDDFYIANALDADSTFPGDLLFRTRTVNGAGDAADFTPSAGSNYQNVDEATQNSDTDYNETSGASKDDLFTGTTVAGAGPVRCVVVNTFMRKPDGGAAVVRGIVKTGGTIYETGDLNPAVTYTKMLQGIIDKNTAMDDVTEANGLQFGYRKVS